MYSISELKKDVLIQLDHVPYRVVESQHVSMGRGGAVMRTKLKNLLNGSVLERTFRAAEKVIPADIERVNMQYLYQEGSDYVFMNEVSFEQIHLPGSLVADQMGYIPEGASVQVLLFNSSPIGLEMAKNVYLKVTHTEPGVKGDTATSAFKSATLETGAEVSVPLFINTGDEIKVDTRTGQYLERRK